MCALGAQGCGLSTELNQQNLSLLYTFNFDLSLFTLFQVQSGQILDLEFRHDFGAGSESNSISVLILILKN